MFGNPKKRAVTVARRAEAVLQQQISRARDAGSISRDLATMFSWIAREALDMFAGIVNDSAFSTQLNRVRPGKAEAALAAYLQMVCHLLWDYSLAFGADEGFRGRLGMEYSEVCALFAKTTGLTQLVQGTLSSSLRHYLQAGGGVDFRPVMDSHTLDFLQTLTDGRYTDSMVEYLGPIQLMITAGAIHMRRLESVKALKDQWDLPGPVV